MTRAKSWREAAGRTREARRIGKAKTLRNPLTFCHQLHSTLHGLGAQTTAHSVRQQRLFNFVLHKGVQGLDTARVSRSSRLCRSRRLIEVAPGPDSDSTYTCTLGPTCNDANPQHFSSLTAYQNHYSTYHSHVCQSTPSPYPFAQDRHDLSKKGEARERQDSDARPVCGRIFPSERLLELHLKECHDPLNQLRHQRGEKTASLDSLPPLCGLSQEWPADRTRDRLQFECLHSSTSEGACRQMFSSPKNRRLHMISIHGYPKEWFFAVVIWGIGQLLLSDNDQEGARGFHGMVRKDWKPRPGQPGYRSEHEPGDEERQEEDRGDREMESLTKELEGSSIGFVPRSVVKHKAKAKMSIERT